MMSDIVERLRGNRRDLWGTDWPHEAADTITRLTARVKELEGAAKELMEAYSFYFPPGNPWGDKLRAALSASQPAPSPVRTDGRYNNAERIFGDD